MKSVLRMSFTNIKRKKLQSFLIAVIIMFSAMIFTTAAGVLAGINSPYEQMHKKLNASHLLLNFDKSMHDAEGMVQWWKKQEKVESVTSVIPAVEISSPLKNGKKVDTQFFMSEIPASITYQDKLVIVEGEKKGAPGPDEIWIPTGLAYGQKLKIGDKLDIPTPDGSKQLVVSGIVVDPVFSTSLINPTRAWVAFGELKQWFPEKSIRSAMIGIRYKGETDDKALWEAFEKHLGKPYSGIKFPYALVSSAFIMMYQLIGIMMLMFSVILLLVALYILSSSIRDAVISDYKTIGILKSMGFTPGNVVIAYTMQMGILALAAIPLGIGLSTFSIRAVMANLLKALGMVDTNLSLTLIFCAVFVILFGLILLSAFLSSRKAGKVRSAEAIRYGAPVEKSLAKQSKFLQSLRKLPVVSYVASNQLLASKRQIVFSFLTFCVTVFVLVLSINCYESLAGSTQNTAALGFDSSDFTILKMDKKGALDNQSIENKIKADPRVKTVIQGDYLTSGAVPKDEKHAAFNIIGNDFTGDMTPIGCQNIEGRSPIRTGEISLATNTAKDYSKKVGDDFTLFLEGKKLTFKVVGIYQSFNNLGQGYRVQTSSVKEANPEYEPKAFMVILKNRKDMDAFKADMENFFGSTVDVQNTREMFDRVMKPILSSMGMAVAFICFIFVLVLIITIFSSSMLSIHKQKKNFGIFKTLGMTPMQVRFSVVLRYLLTGALALVIGMFAGLVLTPPLMTKLCSVFGLVSFPVSTNVVRTVLVVPFSLLVAFICSWIPSGQILKINSRTLVSE